MCRINPVILTIVIFIFKEKTRIKAIHCSLDNDEQMIFLFWQPTAQDTRLCVALPNKIDTFCKSVSHNKHAKKVGTQTQ